MDRSAVAVSPVASNALSSCRPSRYSADRYTTHLARECNWVPTVSSHRDINCRRTVRDSARYRSFVDARSSEAPCPDCNSARNSRMKLSPSARSTCTNV